uniref:Centromere/kinetochore protein zw10 n=1 Tax=Ascaris suum TaxID=6253 RepID=F1KZP2_ASCSU
MDSDGDDELNRRRATNIINEPLLTGGQDVETIDERITCLERELAAAVSDIAHLVDRKYEKFIPEVVAENSLLNKLSDVVRIAEQSEEEIRERIKSIGEDLETYKDKSALSRLAHLRQCKENIGTLEEVEEGFVRLLHTPIEGEEDGLLMNARLITTIENRIEQMNKNGGDIEGLIMDRIYPALQEQLETMKGTLAVSLTNFSQQLYEMVSDTASNLRILRITCEHPSKVSKCLSAMQILGMLDGLLAKLSTWILRDMCSFIIQSKTPNEVFSLGECVGAVVGKREYRIRTDLSIGEGVRKPDLDGIFQTLKRFFGYLEQDLGGVIVSDKNDMRLAQMIGKKTGDQLVDMIVKECLTPAVPYSAEEKPYFEELLTTADNFHEYLTSLGFFTNETITFKKFTDNHNTVFINRRCTTFVTKARALIDSPLMPLVTVGSGEREKWEATEAFKKANSFVGKGVVSEHCPSLMQFMRCKVSDSCVKLFELVEECLKEAAESESEVAAGRLFQTALNMMQLFVLTAPRQHEAQLSSIPLMTAVFYNNCHYLCHCLMTASVELHAQVMRAMKGASCGISLIESIPRLRKVAAQLMEGQLMQCRRQISTILVDEQSSPYKL